MTTPARLLRPLAAVCSLLLVAAAPATAATLTITITGVRNASGHVRVGVCTKSEFLTERCLYHAIVSARPDHVVAVVANVQPGIYAVAAYHDETDAGHLRRGLFGIPKDGTAFSQNPVPRMGPPTFSQTALRIGTRDAVITLVLHYS